MNQKNRYQYVLLFTLFLLPVFIFNSVVHPLPLPPTNPTASVPQQAVGTTDLLYKAKLLLQQKKEKEALQLALEALDRAKVNNNQTQIEKATYLIATIFNKSKNYEKSLEYYKKSLAISQYTDNTKHILTTINNIGVAFSRNRQLDSANIYYKRIINHPSKTKDILFIKASAYTNLANNQTQKNNLLKAQINVLEALEIYDNFQDNPSMANALNILASIYLEQNRLKDAKRTYFEALSLIKDNKDAKSLNLKEGIYDNLSWILYRLKDYHTYVYQEKSFNIRDSLRNEQLSKILAEIEGRFNADAIKKKEQLKTAEEIRKKEHVQNINNILMIISLSLLIGGWLIYRYLKLRQKNLQLELKQQQLIQRTKLEQIQSEAREKILNATLDGKESERKMIAETLHHSVSSLLSSASLHLQASKMILKKDYPQEIDKAQVIINEAADKIRNLSHSLVSSVLLKFGLSYAIQDLCDKYSNSSLLFHCNCNNIRRYAQDFELKINSIIDELLNNIIKHSKANNAEIKLIEKNNYLDISILDDGKGFDPKENRKESGLGLHQIKTRINKMKGDFTIVSSAEEGTAIYISVPIEHRKNPQVLLN